MSRKPELSLPVRLFASSLQGRSISALAQPVLAAWKAATGVALVPEEGPYQGSGLAALLLTGGSEAKLLEAAAAVPGPFLILTHDAHNSLPAGMEAAARLREDGRTVKLVHLGTSKAGGG